LEAELDPRGYLTEGPDEHGRRPRAMYEANDGTVYYGLLAIIMMNAQWESGGFGGLQRDTGHGAETHDQWRCRTGTLPRSSAPPRSRGHERRRGGNQRRRGSRRQSGSSPPGSDDSDPDPPGVSTPPTRRRTAGRAA
jgi:hypothetical protein